MKEFVENIIEILEELKKINYDAYEKSTIIHDKIGYIHNTNAYAKAINIVKELAEEYSANTPQKSAGGWIICSEKQPNKDGYYLVTTSDGEIDVREYDYSKGWGWDGFERIIAWQPLPEPFRTEKAEWKDKVMQHFTKVD